MAADAARRDGTPGPMNAIARVGAPTTAFAGCRCALTSAPQMLNRPPSQ
ncbi:hypothetical protein [Salibaculum sp.]|nr:hypothetical protein [Salibaculum sp.]HKL69704.1 hypothetical protein [Salibaculum sp.]